MKSNKLVLWFFLAAKFNLLLFFLQCVCPLDYVKPIMNLGFTYSVWPLHVHLFTGL